MYDRLRKDLEIGLRLLDTYTDTNTHTFSEQLAHSAVDLHLKETREIDHGKSMARYSVMNIPKVSKEMGGILKFQHVHESSPLSSPIISKYDSICFLSV